LDDAKLAEANPFRLLADRIHDTGANDMEQYTIVVVGASRHKQPGFVIPSSKADSAGGRNFAHGEDLEDSNCLDVAKELPKNYFAK
jgi:hypothetical protein